MEHFDFGFVAGHVTIGGSICMEMLTRSGWTPTNDIEVGLFVFPNLPPCVKVAI